MKIDLIKGNSINILKQMRYRNEKFEAIITDPPYNIARDNNFSTMGRKGIDFGDWDKGFDQFGWIDYTYDLLNNGGSLFIFNDWKNIGEIAKYAESKGFEIKDMVRWRKANPMPRNRDRRYITDFEVAVWLVKPKGKWVFNRQSDTYDRCEYDYGLTPKSEKVGNHMTQKPIALMEDIIKHHTNEGDKVLDCFMGTASTGIACINLNRNFTGIELDSEYFETCKNRVNTYIKENNMQDVKVNIVE